MSYTYQVFVTFNADLILGESNPLREVNKIMSEFGFTEQVKAMTTAPLFKIVSDIPFTSEQLSTIPIQYDAVLKKNMDASVHSIQLA